MIIQNNNLDLDQIANSGQCFRWSKIDEKAWRFPIYDIWHHAWHDEINHDMIYVFREDKRSVNEDIVNYYFDIKTDYRSIIDMIPEDDLYLKDAADAFSGIRILRQGAWETIVSFIISQNNNIPRIKKSIEKLCQDCNGNFPSHIEIKNMNLSDKGLGYRDKYLKDAALWWFRKIGFPYSIINHIEDNTKEQLLEIKGIGPKVADCICLFGLHQLDACPIDTWMKKIIKTRYNGTKPDWMSGEYAGVYQQYVFAYERNNSMHA